MRCTSCHHENPAAAQFCQECGNRLRSACGGCGTELPPAAKFCHQCGRRVGAEAPASPLAPEPVPGFFAGGRYQLRELLGEGARKRVHLAWDARLGREVDLKGISERQRVHTVEWS
jgi:ribosomal protein L40E